MGVHKNLDQLSAASILQELAARPFDLTRPGAVNEERLSRYVCRQAGMELHYAMQRIDEEVLDTLQQLAAESNAVARFIEMKQGDVINRIEGFESEERQVLHTAGRDLFRPYPSAPEATAQAKTELDKLEKFLEEIESGALTNFRGQPFTDLVHVGIGGSDLGPRAVYLALAAYRKSGRRVHFISNVDPDDAAAVLQDLDLSRTLVTIVSKSGTTLETLTNEELVRSAFSRVALDPTRHFIAVTGQGSPMDNPARYLRSFYMFDYIGGRYSVTSMVGLVMLGFALGFDAVQDFIRGAHDMDMAAEEPDLRNNIPLLLALIGIWNRNFLKHDTVAVLPYSQALIRFAAHLQQCDMESNGKSVTQNGEFVSYQTGPIIWGEPGTNGQHAFYQLIHQGTTVVPVELIGFRRSQYNEDRLIQGTTSQEKLLANLMAQSLALATGQDSDNPNKKFAGNRPNSMIIANRLTPYTMGSLLALYEAKIVFQGFVWNINSFDQEGVQLGKVLATRLLNHFSDQRKEIYNGRQRDPLGWELLKNSGLVDKETTS